jgi:hypothetical protein
VGILLRKAPHSAGSGTGKISLVAKTDGYFSGEGGGEKSLLVPHISELRFLLHRIAMTNLLV